MSLQDVLIDELRDLYSAENQLVKALPKMARGAAHPELRQLFTQHLEQTKGQVERLKQAFQQLGKRPSGQHCKGMEGIVSEGQEQLDKDLEGSLKDVAIVGAGLRVEHYEIAAYTGAIAIAKKLGETEVANLLTETLNEEKQAGKLLLGQAKPLLREAAVQGEDEDEEEAGAARGSAGRKRAQAEE